MSFQVISPIQPKKERKPTPNNDDVSVLTLAPFNVNPKIVFENVKVGDAVTQELHIKNPNAFGYEVTVIKWPLVTGELTLNWTESTVSPHDEVILLLKWIPKDVGSWRDNLSIRDNRNVVRDIPVVFKSIVMKKKNVPRLQKKIKTTVTAKTLKPPIKKISPKISKKKVSPLKTSNKNRMVQCPKMDNAIQLTFAKPVTPQMKFCNIESDKENSPISLQNPLYSNLSLDKWTFSEKINRLNSLSVTTPLRRETYFVKKPINRTASPPLSENTFGFTESLNNDRNYSSTPKILVSPASLSSDSLNFQLKLDSESFIYKSLKKGNSESSKDFEEKLLLFYLDSSLKKEKQCNPENVSSIRALFQDIKANDTYELSPECKRHNVSSGTYTKHNTSSGTYVKDDSRAEDITYSFSAESFADGLASHVKLSDPNSSKYNYRCSSPLLIKKENVSEGKSNSALLSTIIDACPAYRNTVLSRIKEEDISESHNFGFKNESIIYTKIGAKRKCETNSDTVLSISPPKRASIENVSLVHDDKLYKKRVEKTMRMSKRHIHMSELSLCNTGIKQSEMLSGIDSFLMATTNCDVIPSTLDLFISSTFYYDEMWLDKLTIELKKWLNVILAPPTDLATNAESKKIDVAKLWYDCCKKSMTYAPTKETISMLYHTNNRLDSLRKNANALFRSLAVNTVLSKVAICIENKHLSIREDHNLHLDVGLQSHVMTLLLCYNPLWLRIGLETIYDEIIPLESNSDITGLSTFILLRLFRDPYLMYKNKHSTVNNVYLPDYSVAVKKFTLKKFLMLVYFLDQAKQKKIIPHDPCLFCKNAIVKESKELLLSFTRELISAVGDITKFLRRYGYIVSHKQNFIDEFNYAVKNLGTDLRDGIRLVKVMETILLRQDLTMHLRVPAISRLQKIYNVKLAMESLQEANYEIVGDITAKDIVDGHREKTLSLLWQIIYKFQAPHFTKATIIIQSWWRSLKIVIKRHILCRPHRLRVDAAIKIQRYYRATKIMRLYRDRYLQIKSATIIIQKFLRFALLCKKDRIQYLLERQAVCTVQRKYRALKAMREQRHKYLQLSSAAVCIQKYYKAKLLMRQCRKFYMKLRESTIILQRQYQANKMMKTYRKKYVEERNAVIIIQRFYREILRKRKLIQSYKLKMNACIVLQKYFRATLQMYKDRNYYKKVRESVICLQHHCKAYLLMKYTRERYLKQKQAAILIQRQFRAILMMKNQRQIYLLERKVIIAVQQKYKSTLIMRKVHQQYLKQRNATIIIQKYYKAAVVMKVARDLFLQLRKAAVIIQQRFRAILFMRKLRQDYLKKKHAVILLQGKIRATFMMKETRKYFLQLRKAVQLLQIRFLANKAMRTNRTQYLQTLEAILIIQHKFRATITMRRDRQKYMLVRTAIYTLQKRIRAFIAMKKIRHNYLLQRKGIITLQIYMKATLAMRETRKQYLELRRTVIFVQRQFRAKLDTKQQKSIFLQYKKSALVIQKYIRATLVMKTKRKCYLQQRTAAIIIQRFIRTSLLMKKVRKHYITKMQSILTLQTYYRAYRLMIRERQCYINQKQAIVTLQKYFKSYLLMKEDRHNYLKQRNAVMTIQIYYKATIIMKKTRKVYLQQREAIILIQQYFKATLYMRQQRQNYLNKKKSAIIIQRKFRSNLTMRKARINYIQIREAVIIIQNRFRATQLMKTYRQSFLKKHQAAVTIQIRYRSTLLMRKERKRYLLIWNATVTLQKYVKALLNTRIIQQNYVRVRQAIITLQQYFKATMLMRYHRKRYLQIKTTTVFIQQQFRAKLASRKERESYVRYRNAVISIQKIFRTTLITRNIYVHYLQQQKAIVTIQRHFRAMRIMKKTRNYYLLLKQNVVTIQKHFRAYLLMKKKRQIYLKQRSAAIILQTYIRCYILMKRERRKYLQLKFVIVVIQRRFRRNYQRKYIELQSFKVQRIVKIQSWIRMVLARKTLKQLRENMKNREEQIKINKLNCAATKIQSLWRGYRVRLASNEQMVIVRKRTIQANDEATSELTLGNRCVHSIYLLTMHSSMQEIIRALTCLDFITRLCPSTCIAVSDTLTEKLYVLLQNTSRSVPDMDACVLSTSILINLAKYSETVMAVWKVQYVDTLLNLLLHWSDKDGLLCPYLCTLLWLFAQKPEHCNIIFNQVNAKKMLLKAYAQCERKQKMLSRVRMRPQQVRGAALNKNAGCNLPSLIPDWGIINKQHPRTFQNPLFGFKCLFKKLNISLY